MDALKSRIHVGLITLLLCAFGLFAMLTGGTVHATGTYIGDTPTVGVPNDTIDATLTGDNFQYDLWLPYAQKALSTTDSSNQIAALHPWALPQVQSDTVTNDVQYPTFHYTVISGTDVVGLSSDSAAGTTSTSLSVTPTPATNSSAAAYVKALTGGTAVVKVTYDGQPYGGKNYGGCSSVNTGYVVYTVNESGTVAPSIPDFIKDQTDVCTGGVIDNHYDTIYFKDGNTVDKTFTVSAAGSASTVVTCNGIVVDANSDGSYTANLGNRSNIIGVTATDSTGAAKSTYYIIDARKIDVTIANATNPGQPISAGNTATVSFTGITMPVYKLATIFNPTWYSPSWNSYGTYVTYTGTDATGLCSQYDLATNNTMTISNIQSNVTGENKLNLTAGHIESQWWGDAIGSDAVKASVGLPNLNAGTHSGSFSTFPDLSIDLSGGTTGTAVTGITVVLDNTELLADSSPENKASSTLTITPSTATNKNVVWTGYFYDTRTNSWEVDSGYYFTVDQNGNVVAQNAPPAGGTVTGFKVRATSVSNPDVYGDSVTFTIQ